jgi:hypothetical protein
MPLLKQVMATKQEALAFHTLLALEDTSSLNFSHKGVNDGLGPHYVLSIQSRISGAFGVAICAH